MPEGQYVTNLEEFELPSRRHPRPAIAPLRRGYRLIVVTNQRGVARGKLTLDDLAAIHRKMEHLLAAYGVALDAIYVCPHGAGECDCRKPQPGMLLQAFERFSDLVPGDRVLFGDSSSDVEAAQRAGVPAVRMPANGSLEAAVQEWFLTGATLGRFVLSPTSTSLRRYSRMVCSHVRKLTGPPNRLLTEK